MSGLDPTGYRALIEARIFEPQALTTALQARRRRSRAGADGRLLILAADHTARGKLSVGDDPLAIADRFTLLDRLAGALSVPGVDGVLGSADVLEELAWLGLLEDRLAIGTMNRGGIIGATWELDDRVTAYDVEHLAAYGLDGGKTLLRIDHTDPAVARTIEAVAAATTALADHALMSLVEALPYRKDDAGRAVEDPTHEAMVKTVAIASGLGASSAHTWLKIPGSDRMTEIAAATSLPILMLGGDPGTDTDRLISRWDTAMNEPNVRGLVAGRPLLYPPHESSADAAAQAAEIVHRERS